MRSYHTGVGDLVVLMCIALCLFLAFLAYNPARVRGLHARVPWGSKEEPFKHGCVACGPCTVPAGYFLTK